MSCTDVVTENCDDADLFVSLDTRDLEQADLIELVANATLRYEICGWNSKQNKFSDLRLDKH